MLNEVDLAAGFLSNPLPGNTGHTFTLTSMFGRFLHEAEALYGPRDPSWTPLGIEFSSKVGPRLWYPGNRQQVSILLSKEAVTDTRQALFQLAHETFHILSPTGESSGSVLEEGMATHFSHMMSAKYGLGLISSLPSYVDAHTLVLKMLAINNEAVRQMRLVNPRVFEFTSEMILEVAPALPHEIAEELCRPFSRSVEQG